MVNEAYCSYKLAKLLVKKGFDSNLVKGALITHQLACAWIRSKGYSVEVRATAVGWNWEVCKVNGTSIAFGGTIPSDKTNDGDAYDDYDECMNNALMYTLINLI